MQLLTNQLIRYMADNVLSAVYEDLAISLPVPIEKIITAYYPDASIHEFDIESVNKALSAFCHKDIRNGWIIGINKGESPQRKRFSLAHELGHMVLTPSMSEIMYCSQASTRNEERACDRFAGAILMPEGSIRLIYKHNSSPSLSSIARLFNVSPIVAKIRLDQLSLPYRTV